MKTKQEGKTALARNMRLIITVKGAPYSRIGDIHDESCDYFVQYKHSVWITGLNIGKSIPLSSAQAFNF